MKQTTSTGDSLGSAQVQLLCFCFVLFPPPCHVFYPFQQLSITSLVTFCTAASLSVICRSFTHVASPHGINSTQHPPIAHGHLIRACLSTVLTFSSKSSVTYEYCHVTTVYLMQCESCHNTLMCVL